MKSPAVENADATVPHFEQHVAAVVGRLRAALAELFQSVDADATRPQGVARDFGLNKNLTWKICKIICEAEPIAIVSYLPGRAGLNILLDSFKKSGAAPKAIKEVRDAVSEFEKMEEIHAGDRESLEAMLGASATGPDAQQQNESQRKLAFRGNSSIWGAQARIQICVNMIAPSSDPDFCDLVWITGLVDFRRLRRDTVWAIASTRKADDDGNPVPTGNIETIDPDFSGDQHAPLIREFCSDPIPDIRLNTGVDGILRYELIEGPIGNTAAATCIIGIFGRKFVRRTCAPGDKMGQHLARLHTPAELLIHDLFVHESLQHAMDPEIHLYNQLPIAPPYPAGGHDCCKLPVFDPVISLGHGTASAVVPEFPRYRALIETACKRLGWNAREFSGFRFRLKYPPIPSIALFRYPLVNA